MQTPVAVAADRGFRPAHQAARLAPMGHALAERTEAAAAMRSGLVLNFAADREIYGEGEAATSFYKVVSGVVRTCKFLSDGCRQIDAFYVAGDVFGFEAGARHWLSAEAVSKCTVLAYPRQRLDMLAADDGRVGLQFFTYALQCLERSQGHSLLLGRRNAAQKVASFLLEMVERGSSREVIDLPMTRQDIADYLGLTIETVSRTLSQMERDGLIDLPSARRVRLAGLEALQELSE